MYKTLKWVRVAVALIFFILITLSFTFIGSSLGSLTEILRFQFVPALISFAGGGIVIVVFFLLMTLLFGRLYCSTICPVGVLQDIVSRIAGIFKTKKQKRTRFSSPHNILRYTILVIVFLFAIFGFIQPLILLDPYSNYGTVASHLFNNGITLVLNMMTHLFPDSVFYRSMAGIVWGSFVTGAVFFTIVVVMSIFRGRLYCNTICPVGSLLGIISKVSLFKLTIDDDKCVKCGVCVKNCKSECIDGENKTIDESRCVACLNCTTVCHGNAISFKLRKNSEHRVDTGRREAVAALGALTALIVAREWRGEKGVQDATESEIGGVVPPGAVSLENLKAHCTACHACVAACPSKIIRPSSGEYGLSGLFLPVIHYDRRFCGYDCNECMKVCPNDALRELPLAQKQTIQLGKVHFIAKNCIVFKDKTDCGACDEHCPTKAITMKEWEGENGLRFPTVNTDICIGCGGCEYICPARPKAMIVKPLAVHGTALPPSKDEQQQKVVTDFGF